MPSRFFNSPITDGIPNLRDRTDTTRTACHGYLGPLPDQQELSHRARKEMAPAGEMNESLACI